MPRDRSEAVKLAWQFHQSVVESTAKADTKASVVLTLHAALLAAILTVLSGTPTVAHGALTLASVAMLVLAIVIAGAAIFPRLDRRGNAAPYTVGIGYFGALRSGTASELAQVLVSEPDDDQLVLICQQVIAVARIAWRKHTLLQASMLSGLTAWLLLGIAALVRL
ncbi:Pycsar system effector family protein [Micromonospora sp. NPDC049523]|uniref:Pycsar system effector family protein n=1 Tax=Micromonospora sp. NPDC049523 TaxID=3155921 RepID=UPI00342B99AC